VRTTTSPPCATTRVSRKPFADLGLPAVVAAGLADGDLESFVEEHDVHGGEPPITLDMVPPHAPREGETWDSTIHHFRCTSCGWDLVLWDAN